MQIDTVTSIYKQTITYFKTVLYILEMRVCIYITLGIDPFKIWSIALVFDHLYIKNM